MLLQGGLLVQTVRGPGAQRPGQALHLRAGCAGLHPSLRAAVAAVAALAATTVAAARMSCYAIAFASSTSRRSRPVAHVHGSAQGWRLQRPQVRHDLVVNTGYLAINTHSPVIDAHRRAMPTL